MSLNFEILFFRDLKNVSSESTKSLAGNLLSSDLLGLSDSSENSAPTFLKVSEIGIPKSSQKSENYSNDLLGLGAVQSSDFDFFGMTSTASSASPNNLFNNNAPHR